MAGKKKNDANGEGGTKTRREQLINAAIEAIAEYGLSNVTLAKVAGLAGLTAAMVNFHFKSKDALLLDSLVHLTDEFHELLKKVIKETGDDPVIALEALIDANFDRLVTEPHKVAVWYAFWGEAGARADYMKVCEIMDNAYRDTFLTLIQEIAKEVERPIDAEAVALGMIGIIDGQWQQLLIEQSAFDHDKARHLCIGFLASVFPGHFKLPTRRGETDIRMRMPSTPYKVESKTGSADTHYTLPGWAYCNDELFALEKDRIFASAWQFICHENDIANMGDYRTMELMGRSIFVVRAKDKKIHAYHNVCRHRAHPLVRGAGGNCGSSLQSSQRGWSYGLDGKLKAIPDEETFGGVNKKQMGLHKVELESFMGFIFIRLKSEGPSVAERFVPMTKDLASYRPAELVKLAGPDLWSVDSNWKNVWDHYLEGYHFNSSNPGQSELATKDYEISANIVGRTAQLSHDFNENTTDTWALRHYQKMAPDQSHLPDPLKHQWSYHFLYPAISFDVSPEAIGIFQVIPDGAGQTTLRYNLYGLPDERRETKLARYLWQRINAQIQKEDDQLIANVQKGLQSGVYERGVLSDKEQIVRDFQQWIINDVPVSDLDEAPKGGSISRRNAEMKLPLAGGEG